MKIRIRTASALLAVFALVGASADSCRKNDGSPESGTKPSMECLPGINCPGNGNVSANPQPSNPGKGEVSGICRFSIQGPPKDTTGDSGLATKRVSPVLWVVTGIVWGYCTDTLQEFALDMNIYYDAGAGPHLVSNRVYRQPPGPSPIPYVLTAPCAPGTYRLEWTITALDHADNVLPGGPFGGQKKVISAVDCGLVPGSR